MTREQQQRSYELACELMRAERLVESKGAALEASVYTGDSKRINQAHEEAVEAFRDLADAKVAVIQHNLRCARGLYD